MLCRHLNLVQILPGRHGEYHLPDFCFCFFMLKQTIKQTKKKQKKPYKGSSLYKKVITGVISMGQPVKHLVAAQDLWPLVLPKPRAEAPPHWTLQKTVKLWFPTRRSWYMTFTSKLIISEVKPLSFTETTSFSPRIKDRENSVSWFLTQHSIHSPAPHIQDDHAHTLGSQMKWLPLKSL